VARKIRKHKTKIADNTSDDTDYLKRQLLFDFLIKLGLKTPPTWFGGFTDNFGAPDQMYMDPATLKAYIKAFGGK
jgi:hypothetical protein